MKNEMLKNQMRRLVAAVLAVALLLTCGACGIFGIGTKRGEEPGSQSTGKNSSAGSGGNNVVSAALALPQENPRSDCGAKRYRMELTLDDSAHVLSGSVTAEVENRTDETLNTLCFRFFAAAITSGSALISAGNENGTRSYAVSSGNDGSVLYIDLGRDALAPGKTLAVKLDFSAVIPRRNDRFGYHVSADGTLYNLTFCFPQLSFLQNDVWDTDPYIDMGETTFSELSDYEVTLHAPASFAVLSSGTAETVNGVTTIHAPRIREMAITACDFGEIIQKEAQGVTYRLLAPTYRLGDDAYRAALYDLLLETAIASVSYYCETVGHYCYDELDVIPAPLDSSGGMEMPGLIYVGVSADVTAEGDPAFYDDVAYVFDTVAHEVSHEWFYCAVGNDQYDDAWLDEAFAMFCASEFLRNDAGAVEKMEAMAQQYNGVTHAKDNYLETMYDETPRETVYINLPCGNYIDDETYSRAVYNRGYLFLRTLCGIMGEETFRSMLADWYAENSGKIVTDRLFVAQVLRYDDSEQVERCLDSYLSDDYL